MKIDAYINGKPVSRQAVLDWEDKRFAPAAKKLGVPTPTGPTVAARRDSFVATKLELGTDEMRRRLNKDVRISDRVGIGAAKFGSGRKTSITELRVEGADAGRFAEWFAAAALNPDQTSMLRANPDHFIIRPTDRGQEVLETTGGSPVGTYFVVDYDDVSHLRTAPDPAFPFQVAGVARASNGDAIGGVRHQFRDAENVMVARLTVEFPSLTAPWMVSQHRWHLACEFSNWIEDAFSH